MIGDVPVEHLERPDDPRLADYRHVPDPVLLRGAQIFVAEGRLVVRTLLHSPLETRSLLLTDAAFRGLSDLLAPCLATLPVYIVSEGTIEAVTGFNLHRGCLAIGIRPPRTSIAGLLGRLPSARRLVVLEGVGNADNVGGIFRSAAALGADAVVLGPGCCDPLYRKAIRVSMGAALRVPFCHTGAWPVDLDAIRSAGFIVAGLATSPGARDLGSWAAALPGDARLALLAGSESEGVSEAALAHADVVVRIPMVPGTDSLNVSTATAIALHACFPGR